MAEERSRLAECVEAWPDCYSGGYDPHCCRFPKSCSCDVYPDPAALGYHPEPVVRTVAQGIPVERLLRLLDAIVSLVRTDPSMFSHFVHNGWNFTPDLDLENVATMARIASGERWGA